MFYKYKSMRALSVIVPVIALALLTPMWARAEGEVAGSIGIARFSGGGDMKLNYGGSAGVNLGRTHLFGGLDYVSLGSETYSYGNVTAKSSGKMINYGGGVQILIPEVNEKIVPDVLMSFGLGRTTITGTGTYTTVVGGRPSTTSTSISVSDNPIYVGFGGGVRLFLGDSWGIRPELEYRRYTKIDTEGARLVDYGSVVRVGASIFFRFAKK